MQNEFIKNMNIATALYIEKLGRALFRTLMNTYYGMLTDPDGAYEYRKLGMVFKGANMMPLDREASFNSVIEWDCQIFAYSVFRWFRSDYRKNVAEIKLDYPWLYFPSIPYDNDLFDDIDNLEVPFWTLRTYRTNDGYLDGVHAIWPHDDKFEMFDRTLAPRGFNKNGFPTPAMLDVVTRERHSKAAHRSYMTSKNAQNRALLWEQENENNE